MCQNEAWQMSRFGSKQGQPCCLSGRCYCVGTAMPQPPKSLSILAALRGHEQHHRCKLSGTAPCLPASYRYHLHGSALAAAHKPSARAGSCCKVLPNSAERQASAGTPACYRPCNFFGKAMLRVGMFAPGLSRVPSSHACVRPPAKLPAALACRSWTLQTRSSQLGLICTVCSLPSCAGRPYCKLSLFQTGHGM